MLTGGLRPDEGEVPFEGEPVRFASPRAAQDPGISTTYQEVDLVGCAAPPTTCSSGASHAPASASPTGGGCKRAG